MKKYLVGGAVRDKVLNIPNNDMDYVVVNSSIQEMLNLGFEQVGKSFPVFLDKNGDQYALARKEISTGVRHHDFNFETNNVSLKDDLFRRDLTINALAIDENGDIIDYFNGMNDLKNKIIRHVSDAFTEDPLRVFRVARFAAKFHEFNVAEDTMQLMENMVENGAVDNISKERIYEEFNKAIEYKTFYKFLEILNKIKALKYMPFMDFNSEEIEFIKNSKIVSSNVSKNNLFNLVYTMVQFNKQPVFNVKFYDNEKKDFIALCFNWLFLIKNNNFEDIFKLYNQKSIAMVENFKEFLNKNERDKIDNIISKFNNISNEISKFSKNSKNGQDIAKYKNNLINSTFFIN